MSDLVLVKPDDFAILGPDSAEFMEVFKENLDGMNIGFSDLERIKIPAGGALAWELEGDDGTAYEPSFSAIIIAAQPTKAKFELPYDEAPDQKPECVSYDGKTGTGKHAAACNSVCADCPLSKWGENDNSNPECMSSLVFVLLRSDSMLPTVLRVPPTSIKPARSYFTKLTAKMKSRSGVVTEFTLLADKNPEGIKFSKLVLRTSKESTLTADQKAIVKTIANQYADLIQKTVNDEMQAGNSETAVNSDEDPVYGD